ncbi:MAG TPA: hypothetical protein VFC43_02580 [Methanoregula sp.]|nr:hypothetical protein [Methanoregula sp.]
MKKHEVILARHAGKMIIPAPDTTKGMSVLHELDAMRTSEMPPRSPEVLWELAKERKNINAAGNRMSSEVAWNTITGDFSHVPEDLRKYHFTGFDLTSTPKTTPLLPSAKESETPMLPIARSLPIVHGKER